MPPVAGAVYSLARSCFPRLVWNVLGARCWERVQRLLVPEALGLTSEQRLQEAALVTVLGFPLETAVGQGGSTDSALIWKVLFCFFRSGGGTGGMNDSS